MAVLRRVMIVDDDAAIAEMLTRALSRFYEVSVVHDGDLVIDEAKRFLPELALLDVNLPHQDGFTIAQAMKLTPGLDRIPIIFITAQTHSLDVVKGIQAGAKHYVTKPFKVDDVVQKVRRLVPPG